MGEGFQFPDRIQPGRCVDEARGVVWGAECSQPGFHNNQNEWLM